MVSDEIIWGDKMREDVNIILDAIRDAEKMEAQGMSPPPTDGWWYGGWLPEIKKYIGRLKYDPHPMVECWNGCRGWAEFWRVFYEELRLIEEELPPVIGVIQCGDSKLEYEVRDVFVPEPNILFIDPVTGSLSEYPRFPSEQDPVYAQEWGRIREYLNGNHYEQLIDAAINEYIIDAC